MLYDALSIWEIAHRWHGYDPNVTNPESLPLEVQDTLRFITRKLAYHELSSCTSRGAKHLTHADIANFDEFISWQDNAEALSDGEKYSLYENYTETMESKLDKHYEITEELDLCFEKRIYNREKLDSTYTLKFELAKMCEDNGTRLPTFWYPEGWQNAYGLSGSTQEQEATKLRPNQIDNQLCQAIASTLWAEFPDYTIEQIIKHPSIQRFGNGAQYKERTLRDWVRYVDPRPEDKRSGRPKKS